MEPHNSQQNPMSVPQPAFTSGAYMPPQQSNPNGQMPPSQAQEMKQQPATLQSTEDQDSLLDKEWVEKARNIVAKMHSDPYSQAQQISGLKAQYIKARYNKDIKAEE